jgi:hypothetical protein
LDIDQVGFVAGDIRDVSLSQDFDTVVGRLMLMYWAHPVKTLGAALGHVRPDGFAAFHEMNVGAPVWSDPVSPLHQLLGRCVNQTFARGDVETAMGTRLHDEFVAAGLEPPEMTTAAIVGAGELWARRFAAAVGAGLLRSMLPMILEHRVATEVELDLDTFDERYVAEVVRQRSVVQWIPFVGARARKRSS